MAPGDLEAAGHGVDQQDVDQDGAEEHSVDEHSVDEHSVDEHSVDEHSVDEHSVDEHSVDEKSAGEAARAALIESGQIRRAVTIAEKRTGLNWSVFIGALGAEPRKQAEARHAELGPAAARSVLIAVDPAAHRLEIVTGEHARTVVDDRSSALAAASMTSTFAVRDLDGGIARGILAMVEHARRGK